MRRLIYLGLVVAATLVVSVAVVRLGYESPASRSTLAGSVPLDIQKDCPVLTGTERVGDVVSFPVRITNGIAGTPLTNVAVVDSRDGLGGLGLVPALPTTLEPFVTYSFVYNAVITQDDADTESLNNSITVTADDGGGSYASFYEDTDTADDCSWDPFVAASIVKTATDGYGNEIDTAAYNDEILYIYRITNTGDGPFTLTSLFDDNGTPGDTSDDPLVCQGFTLFADEFIECDLFYEVSVNDVAVGSITNIATLYRDEDVFLATSNPETVTITQDPSLSITKTATDGEGEEIDAADLGDIITYFYFVENTGDVPLEDVTVSDDVLGPVTDCEVIFEDTSVGAAGGPATITLYPDDEMECFADHEVTLDDVAAGEIVNTGTVSGTPPAGPDVEASAEETVTINQHPELFAFKEAFPDEDVEVGETIEYSFGIDNEGDVPLTGITVTDSNLGPIDYDDCEIFQEGGPGLPFTGTLAVLQFASCEVEYVVTLDDAIAGEIVNTATVESDQTDPFTTDEVVVTVVQRASLAITKSADPTTADLGDPITYTYEIENTGALPLTGVIVTDDPLGVIADCPETIDVREIATCTFEHEVTLDDVAAGEIVNTASADSAETEPVTSNEVTVVVNQHPALTITKSAAPDPANLNDTIIYTYEVENTGDLPLTGIAVTDSNLGPVTGCPTTLAVGATGICTAEHVVTLEDVLAASIANTATADSAETDPVTSNEVTVTINQHPSLALTKTAGAPTADIGATVDYSYLVHNTGDVPLTAVGVTDDHVATVACPATTLAPDDGAAGGADETTCTGSYTVSEADILDADGTTLRNVATASGTPPVGAAVTATDDATVTVTPQPAIAVAKTCPAQVEAGAPIAITATVTNTGDVSVAGIAVVDDHGTPADPADDVTLTLASGDTNSDGRLDLTESWLFTGSYVAATADQTDIVTASGTGVAPATASCDTEVLNPAIEVAKACPAQVEAGDPIAITATATNPGDTPLSDVTVVDNHGTPADPADDVTLTLAGGDTNGNSLLDPGESWLFTGSYVAGTADQTDIVTATGSDPLDTAVSDTASCDTEVLNPAIAVAKTCTVEVNVGEEIAVTATVTNPGDTPLSDVTVVDDAGTPDDTSDDFLLTLDVTTDLNDDDLLEPGETWVFNGSYTAPADDVTDTATATGSDPLGTEVAASDSCDTAVGPGEPCEFAVTFNFQNVPFAGVVINGTVVYDEGALVNGGCEGTFTFDGTVDGAAASAVWTGSIRPGGVAGLRAFVVGGTFDLEIEEITTWSVPGVPEPETPVAVTIVNTGPIIEIDAVEVEATLAIEPELEVPFETNTVYVITPLTAPDTGVGPAARQFGPLSGLATVLPALALALVVLSRRRSFRLR